MKVERVVSVVKVEGMKVVEGVELKEEGVRRVKVEGMRVVGEGKVERVVEGVEVEGAKAEGVEIAVVVVRGWRWRECGEWW